MTKIKNLIFDLGGVLCDLDWKRCLAAFRSLGVTVDRPLEEVAKIEIFRRIDRGTATPAEFWDELRRIGNVPHATDAQLAEAWNSFLAGIPAQRLRALERLHKSFTLYLLSNVNDVHWQYCRHHFFAIDGQDALAWFCRLFLSYEMHLEKPEPAIYEAVAREAGIDPSESLFIDDHAENVEAARGVGFHALQALGDEWIAPLDRLAATEGKSI